MSPDATTVATATAAPARSTTSRTHLPLRLGVLVTVAVAVCAVYLTLDLTGNIAWVLERRATTIATMLLVSAAVAIATIVFHTVTTNQILTPSIMGFDALYILIQTVGVHSLGPSGILQVNPLVRFLIEGLLMVGLSLALYRWLLIDLRRSLHLLILVGVVIGGLFRSIATLLQRLMDPTAFIVLQDRFFADFTGAPTNLLGVSAVIVAAVTLALWWHRRTLDVVALGREVAVNLGVDHRRAMLWCLAAVAVLVSVATALVGPTSFLGLLVAHIAYQVLRTSRHAWTIPAAFAASVIALVGGQLVFERLLGFEGSLSMIVEFLGGILFIALLLRRRTS